jgi:hypothetical protein
MSAKNVGQEPASSEVEGTRHPSLEVFFAREIPPPAGEARAFGMTPSEPVT